MLLALSNADISQNLPLASPRTFTDGGAASYLITGGTGGPGRSITRWLAQQGARHIILVSRSGTSSRGVQQLVEEMKEKEVNVVVDRCDVADRAQVQRLVLKPYHPSKESSMAPGLHGMYYSRKCHTNTET